jgi:hypothetical protein
MTTTPALPKILKGILHMEDKYNNKDMRKKKVLPDE